METTHEQAHDAGNGVAEHDAGDHGMSTSGYVRIALILGAITGLEVSTNYVDLGPLFLPALLIMMTIKFIMVVSYFMHLKFDNKMFSMMFYAGLILAIGVYCAALGTFKFFLS